MDAVKLTFLGDIMCTKDMISSFCKNGKYDFSTAFQNTTSLFQDSQAVIGNLETTLSYSHNNLTTEPYSFCAPIEFAQALKKCGIDILTTANNHCLDRGISGLLETIDCLDNCSIKHVGTRKTTSGKNYLLLQLGGLKISILSFTYGTNAFSNGEYLKIKDFFKVNLYQHQELFCRIGKYAYDHPTRFISTFLRKTFNHILPYNKGKEAYERRSPSLVRLLDLKWSIFKAKHNSDFVIMCLHTGGQFNKEATPETIKLVQKLYNYGVNIVIANHEHIIHGVDCSHINKNHFATYSLGNFISPYGVNQGSTDMLAEYSLALNIYIYIYNTTRSIIGKISYNILKTIETKHNGEKQLNTINTFDLYNKLNPKSDQTYKLISDLTVIAKKIGHEFSDIKNEYIIYEANTKQ